MVSNSAKLDRRTKQHTQFGVSASNGSRDITQTKSWRKREKKKNNKINNEANWMVSNSAQLDRRTKQHTEFGVSASNGSRDMGRTKSRRKKKRKKKKEEKKKNEHRQNYVASPTGIANEPSKIEWLGIPRRDTFQSPGRDEQSRRKIGSWPSSFPKERKQCSGRVPNPSMLMRLGKGNINLSMCTMVPRNQGE